MVFVCGRRGVVGVGSRKRLGSGFAGFRVQD